MILMIPTKTPPGIISFFFLVFCYYRILQKFLHEFLQCCLQVFHRKLFQIIPEIPSKLVQIFLQKVYQYFFRTCSRDCIENTRRQVSWYSSRYSWQAEIPPAIPPCIYPEIYPAFPLNKTVRITPRILRNLIINFHMFP